MWGSPSQGIPTRDSFRTLTFMDPDTRGAGKEESGKEGTKSPVVVLISLFPHLLSEGNEDTHFYAPPGTELAWPVRRPRSVLRVTASLCDICDLSGRTTRIRSRPTSREGQLFLNFATGRLSISSLLPSWSIGKHREKGHEVPKDHSLCPL